MAEDILRPGGCLCGAVRYEVRGRPVRGGICHCRTCRKTASAASVPYAMFPEAAFRLTQGTPRTYRSSPPCHAAHSATPADRR